MGCHYEEDVQELENGTRVRRVQERAVGVGEGHRLLAMWKYWSKNRRRADTTKGANEIEGAVGRCWVRCRGGLWWSVVSLLGFILYSNLR